MWKSVAWAACLLPVVAGCGFVHNVATEARLASAPGGAGGDLGQNARTAWQGVQDRHSGRAFTAEFRNGFLDGYVNYFEGGADDPSRARPPRRWAWVRKFFPSDNSCLSRDYPIGYRYGSEVAGMEGQGGFAPFPRPLLGSLPRGAAQRSFATSPQWSGPAQPPGVFLNPAPPPVVPYTPPAPRAMKTPAVPEPKAAEPKTPGSDAPPPPGPGSALTTPSAGDGGAVGTPASPGGKVTPLPVPATSDSPPVPSAPLPAPKPRVEPLPVPPEGPPTPPPSALEAPPGPRVELRPVLEVVPPPPPTPVPPAVWLPGKIAPIPAFLGVIPVVPFQHVLPKPIPTDLSAR